MSLPWFSPRSYGRLGDLSFFEDVEYFLAEWLYNWTSMPCLRLLSAEGKGVGGIAWEYFGTANLAVPPA